MFYWHEWLNILKLFRQIILWTILNFYNKLSFVVYNDCARTNRNTEWKSTAIIYSLHPETHHTAAPVHPIYNSLKLIYIIKLNCCFDTQMPCIFYERRKYVSSKKIERKIFIVQSVNCILKMQLYWLRSYAFIWDTE